MKNQRLVFKLVVLCLVLPRLAAMETSAQTLPVLFQGSELEQFLTQAKITRMKSLPVGVTLPQKASLELNGTTHFGIFKTIDEGPIPSKMLDRGMEVQFQDSWRTEIAAYQLDKLLGLGMVPATVERTVDGKHGSLQFWIDSNMTEAQRLTRKLSPPNRVDWQNQVAKIRLFDNLVYNTDRHLDNLLVTDDWKIRLIDHSRTFRPFDELKDPKMLTIFSRALLAKLETLDEPLLNEQLGKYLTPYQIRGLLKRRDLILALSKKLVAEKGSGAVLYQ